MYCGDCIMANGGCSGGFTGAAAAEGAGVPKLGVNDLADGLNVNDLAFALSFDLGLSVSFSVVGSFASDFSASSCLVAAFDSVHIKHETERFSKWNTTILHYEFFETIFD